MNRMRQYKKGSFVKKYQPGGMLMYGDPKLGNQTFSNIVYQESEAGKEEALKKQMEEAQADNTAMEEANAALQRNYAIGNRIEASGQTALRAGAQGLKNLVTPEVGKTVAKEVGKTAADPLLGQTPNWAAAMIPNAAGETASLASGTAAAAATPAATNAAFTPSVNIAAEAGTNLASKSPGMFGKLGQSFIANANPQHFAKVSPYAIAGNLAGQGIKYLSDDNDATTMNFGEGAGGVISGAASGAGFGSILGPVGTAVGAGVGALYGLGKGIYQRNKARNAIGGAEDEKAAELNRIGAQMRAEGVKSREYSGYDFGRTLAKHGGPRMYQNAGFDMSMLANNNLPSGYTTYQDTEPHTAVAAPEDTFMNRVHKFAQNPVTQIQKAANMTPGGVTGRNTMDYAVDLINLPGAVSKVVQGASKGDPSKLAAGIVQSVPYAKPITKGLGVLENVGANATNAYKTFANNTLGLGKDYSKYAMKGIVKNASPDFINQEVIDSTLVDPRTVSQESTRVDMPMYRFKAGGVKLPGGTMNPIPGSDAVEFKGRPHSKGGILLDEQTEVEGGETMDKVTMKNEGPSDYFFSKYLKLGGRSYAQRHKDILKKGGTQQDINALAKSQEMAAGRNPGVVEMEKGGVRKYQGAGPRLDETGRLIDTRYPYLTNSMYQDIENFKPGYFNPPVYGPNRPPKAAQSAPVDISSVGNFYTPMNPALPDYQITMGVPELQIPGSGNQVDYLAGIKPRKQKAAQQREDVNLYSPNFYNPTEAQDDTKVAMNIGYVEGVPSFLETPRNIPYKPRPIDLGQEEETVNKVEDKATVTPTKATSKTTTSTSTPAVDDLPDLVYEDTQLEAIPEEAEAEAFLTKEQLDAKKAIEKKIQNNIPLTKEEEKALRNMYREAPALAMAAGAAQMIPAAYAFLRKEKAQKLMGPAGRIGAPKLERVDFNKERSQNASDARALSKSIETSGAGPAGIIAKMAAYGRKQTGDMQIAASESRANAGIQAQEAQMEQRADMMNIQNAMAVDNVNTQMMEAQRVANENRRYMALDAASQRASGLAGDYLSYKAQERLARTMGSMGIYERERLAKSLLGKINPRTSKLYTREDISKIYNINLDDPAIKEEGKKKEKE